MTVLVYYLRAKAGGACSSGATDVVAAFSFIVIGLVIHRELWAVRIRDLVVFTGVVLVRVCRIIVNNRLLGS